MKNSREKRKKITESLIVTITHDRTYSGSRKKRKEASVGEPEGSVPSRAEVEEVTTLFLVEQPIGGPAPRDCCILKDYNKLIFQLL